MFFENTFRCVLMKKSKETIMTRVKKQLPMGREKHTGVAHKILCMNLYHNLKQSLKKNSTETVGIEVIRTYRQDGKREDLDSDSPGFKYWFCYLMTSYLTSLSLNFYCGELTGLLLRLKLSSVWRRDQRNFWPRWRCKQIRFASSHNKKKDNDQFKNKEQPEMPEKQTIWKSDNQRVQEETFIQTSRRGTDRQLGQRGCAVRRRWGERGSWHQNLWLHKAEVGNAVIK